MTTIRDVQQALQLALVESAHAYGVQTGWQRRRSRLSPSQFVQTLVWGFLEAPEATLGQVAQVAHATGALVTPQALSQRFSARSVALLRGVLSDALGVLLEAEPVDVPLLRAFPGGVYLDDSTQIALPAVWQTTWDGGGTAAALKIPARFDLLRGGLQLELTAARHHDAVTRLANLPFPPASVVIEGGDRRLGLPGQPAHATTPGAGSGNHRPTARDAGAVRPAGTAHQSADLVTPPPWPAGGTGGGVAGAAAAVGGAARRACHRLPPPHASGWACGRRRSDMAAPPISPRWRWPTGSWR